MQLCRTGKIILGVSVGVILLAGFAAYYFKGNDKLSSLTASKLGSWRKTTTMTIGF